MSQESIIPVANNATSRNDLIERGFTRQPIRIDVDIARSLEALSFHAAWSIPKPMATQFNFTFDFQAGVEHFNSSGTRAWSFVAKVQHISNASRSSVNPGANIAMFSVGYSFFK